VGAATSGAEGDVAGHARAVAAGTPNVSYQSQLATHEAMKTLADLFAKLEREQRPDLLMVRSGAAFRPIGAGEFCQCTRRCAGALAELGIGRGDRVGLLCSNRPSWHVIDFACHLRGAVLVPLFSTLTAAQVRFAFADSGCKAIFAEGREQADKVVAVRGELTELASLVFIAEDEAALGTPAPAVSAGGRQAIDGSAGGGAAPVADSNPVAGQIAAAAGADVAFEELLAGSEPGTDCPGPESEGSVATIIYTSGTTGAPKGVMLTHGNLISNVLAVQDVLPCMPGDRALSVLPLCHIFERTVDYANLYGGAQLAYGVPTRLAEDYVLAKPTVVAGVPRLFERFHAAVLERVAEGSALSARIFHWAESVGMRRARHELLGEPFSLADRLRLAVADRLVLRKVRAAAGGRIRHFVSGGAALDPALNWWFEAMGLRLVQGYGLTETSPIISANPHEANRIGTVGLPFPGVEVKIAADGEILTRGPHVMKGYWNNPQATAEAIVDGWLHTGDIGELDEDGYLSITDRKKHLLVTSTGKNVAPQPLENALGRSPYIQQVAVIGDARPFIAALIVPELSALRRWAAERGKPTGAPELCADADAGALIQSELDRLQVDFARFEKVRAFQLLPEPFSIEAGTLTPTLKTVRRTIEEKYADVIEGIYRGEKPPAGSGE
jgi:long-chain acyl-CoA synthetase